MDVMPIDDMTTRFGIFSFWREKGRRLAALAWKAVEGKLHDALGAARGRKRKRGPYPGCPLEVTCRPPDEGRGWEDGVAFVDLPVVARSSVIALLRKCKARRDVGLPLQRRGRVHMVHLGEHYGSRDSRRNCSPPGRGRSAGPRDRLGWPHFETS